LSGWLGVSGNEVWGRRLIKYGWEETGRHHGQCDFRKGGGG